MNLVSHAIAKNGTLQFELGRKVLFNFFISFSYARKFDLLNFDWVEKNRSTSAPPPPLSRILWLALSPDRTPS